MLDGWFGDTAVSRMHGPALRYLSTSAAWVRKKSWVAVLANMSSLEKAEITQDILPIMLGAQPAAWPVRPDWRQSTFIPNRAA